MNEPSIPPTLGEAILTEPAWLQAWVLVLVLTNLASLLFIVTKAESWKVRPEPIGIIIAFLIAAAIMDWMYIQFGYVRLLGAAHLVAWLPVYIWIVIRRRDIGIETAFGKYIHVYLVVAGISLIIDFIDVIRYYTGDGELFNRWAFAAS